MQAASHAFETYRQTRVTTASQGQLVVLAYEGALKWIGRARQQLEQEKPDVAQVHEAIIKAQDILGELQSSLRLDEGGEVAQNLYQLYDFLNAQLVAANIRKDGEGLDAVANILQELLEAWKTVAHVAPAAPAQPVGSAQPTAAAAAANYSPETGAGTRAIPQTPTRPSLNISG